MKNIIILISLCIAPLLLQVQLHATEYKVVCKRVTGCPVVNGTCPTCEIVQNGQTFQKVTNEQIREWGKRMKEEMKYDYSSLKNDDPSKRRTGWEWDGPTWKGLWVLY